jgi:hypothetical protein
LRFPPFLARYISLIVPKIQLHLIAADKLLECDDHLRVIASFVARLTVLALNASQSETNQLIYRDRLGFVDDFITPIEDRLQLITKGQYPLQCSVCHGRSMQSSLLNQTGFPCKSN